MFLFFLILMDTAITGVLWHEIIGIGIGILVLSHLLINRQWIRQVARRLTDPIGWKVKAQFVLNVFLLVGILTTLITGILISEYLFIYLAADDFSFWYTLHIISSWVTLAAILIHAAWHRRWVAGLIRRLAQSKPPQKIKALAAHLLILVMAGLSVYALLKNPAMDVLIAGLSANKQTALTVVHTTETTEIMLTEEGYAALLPEDTAVADSTPDTSETVDGEDNQISGSDAAQADEPIITPVPTTEKTDVISLAEYLGQFNCTLCHKHCLLTNPRCNKGVRVAQQYEERYDTAIENGDTSDL